MDLFKAQLVRLQAQLQQLSASQKMLTGTLVAIMVATLFYWVRYAGDPEQVSLLDQTLSQDDIGSISNCLQVKGIPFTVAGEKIMVATDKRFEALADLSYEHALPQNFATGFDQITKEMNPFESSDLTDAKFNHAKEITLSQVLSRFPGVSNAAVMIDATNDRSFTDPVKPSSTISISTRDGGRDHIKELVNSAADMVCGYVSGLERDRVSVIVDGVSYPVQGRSDDDFASGEQLDEIRQSEDMYAQKVRDNLSYIQGLTVAVTAEVDTKRTDMRSTTVDQKNTIHMEQTTHEHTEDTTTPPPGGEPGVSPNTDSNATASVAGPGGGGSGGGGSTSISDDETSFVVIPSTTQEDVHQAAGNMKVVHASVQVPRSYFIETWKTDNNSQSAPDETTLAKWMEDQKTQIRQSVMACCDLTSDDAVVVASYSDISSSAGGTDMTATPQLASSGVAGMLGSHGKELGVGALAAVSLFMMMMMVRKSTPAPVLIPPPPPEPIKLNTKSDIAGEAVPGTATLDAFELDSETLRTQQMVDQVQSMVTEDPDAAANLVKRWLNRS